MHDFTENLKHDTILNAWIQNPVRHSDSHIKFRLWAALTSHFCHFFDSPKKGDFETFYLARQNTDEIASCKDCLCWSEIGAKNTTQTKIQRCTCQCVERKCEMCDFHLTPLSQIFDRLHHIRTTLVLCVNNLSLYAFSLWPFHIKWINFFT